MKANQTQTGAGETAAQLDKNQLEMALFRALRDFAENDGTTPINPAISVDRLGNVCYGSSLHNGQDDMILVDLQEGCGGYHLNADQINQADAVSDQWATDIYDECRREWNDWMESAK